MTLGQALDEYVDKHGPAFKNYYDIPAVYIFEDKNGEVNVVGTINSDGWEGAFCKTVNISQELDQKKKELDQLKRQIKALERDKNSMEKSVQRIAKKYVRGANGS